MDPQPWGGDILSHMVKVVTPIIPTVYNNTTEFPQKVSLRRHLDIGDFDEINTILEGVVIDIPDQTVSQNALFTLTLDLKKIKCFAFSVGDILLGTELKPIEAGGEELEMTLDVIDLDLTCSLDYNYRYSFLRGSGSADAYAKDSSATIGVAFQSEADFGILPPSDFEVNECGLSIELDLDFRGDFVSGILDLFSGLIANTIEDELQGIGCSEITDGIAPLGAELIVNANDLISPYLEALSVEYANPLYPESTLVVPPEIDLLNLDDIENELGSLVSFVIDTVRDFLDIGKDDNITEVANVTTAANNETTVKELKINEIIRDNLLEDDRSLSINITDLNLTDVAPDGVIYEGENELTDTKITLQGIKLFGLDTFTTFDPVSNIGKYTLQSEVVLSSLEIEVALEIDVQPSTADNSLFEAASNVDDSERIIEQITIRVGVEDVAATLSVFVAIDQEKLEGLTLGNLLDIDRLIGCLVSTIYDAQISGLNVTIGDIRTPVTAGFVSVGIERLLDNVINSLLIMYEAVLLDALPNVFQTLVRDTINNDLIGSYLNDPINTVCVKRTKSPSFQPSVFRSDVPTILPSASPSTSPTKSFSSSPSTTPSKKPTTTSPTASPTTSTTTSPTTSSPTTSSPTTTSPTTKSPSALPSSTTSSPILVTPLNDPTESSVELPQQPPIQQAPPEEEPTNDDDDDDDELVFFPTSFSPDDTLSPDAYDWLEYFTLTKPPNIGLRRRHHQDGP